MELCDCVDSLKKRYIITNSKKVDYLNIRSKNLKIRNLPKDGRQIDQINSKPYVFLISFLVMGILLMLCKSYLLGTILLALFLYNFCFVKNSVLIRFYEEYVVFYNHANKKDECFLLFWEDIAKWQYVRTRSDFDELQITLKDGKKVTIKCIGKQKTLRYFKRYAMPPEKVAMHSRSL